MAKPESLPVIKGREAKELAERLEKPSAPIHAKKLFRSALAEYREAEKARSSSGD